MRRPYLLSCLLLGVVAAAPGGAVVAQAPRHNVILVTLDGARIEEMFGGLDVSVLQSTLREGQKLEDHETYRRFWAASPEDRRQKLMPFFWGTLMREHGSIAGNRACGSEVGLANGQRFSYPGYAEILLGVAHDDRIASNDPVRIPFQTVLEHLAGTFRLGPRQVALFGSWSVFSAIAESREGTLTVNAGFAPIAGDDDPLIGQLSAMQRETPTPWNSVRHDVYTFRFAMRHLERYRPRVLYLALGETDDWAHDGRYDRTLDAFARADEYLRQLWTWVQEQPEYRGTTSLLLTTDHGRGDSPADWRHHGQKYPASGRAWMAFVSPSMARRGEWCTHPPLTVGQTAATLVTWMGADWKAFNPAAAPPVPVN